MEIIKPLITFKELDEDSRSLVLKIIREFIKTRKEEIPFHSLGMGMESLEDSLIEMLDRGIVKIISRSEGEISYIGLQIYDPLEKEYFSI